MAASPTEATGAFGVRLAKLKWKHEVPKSGGQDADRQGTTAAICGVPTPFEEEYVLTLGCLLRGLEVTNRDRAVKQGTANVVFLVLFLFVASWGSPVASVFEAQRGVVQSLQARAFQSVSNDREFWDWVQTVLYPQVYQSSDYSGANRTSPSSFAVAKYNRLTTPLRFRQVRSQENECNVPAEVHALSRPCWPEYSSSFSDKTARNLSLANTLGSVYYTDGLSMLMSGQKFGGTYSTGGHTVDLELHTGDALVKLETMVHGRWTDEWTRAVAVDINVYNPNYDVVTAFRFQVDRMLGGRLAPHVEVSSCILSPYSGAEGMERIVVELAWFFGYYVIILMEIWSWWRRGSRVYFGSLWTWLELASLVCYAAMVLGRVDYLAHDRSFHRTLHITEFKDLHSVCRSFNATVGFAGFAAVWSFLRALRYLHLHPRLLVISQVFARSFVVTIPFTIIMLLVCVSFSQSGSWLFGAQMYGFKNYEDALGLLFRSMIVGLSNKAEGEFVHASWTSKGGPVGAPTWTILWTISSKFIISNMFVAILVVSYAFVAGNTKRRTQLELSFPVPSWADHFQSKCMCFCKDPDQRESLEKIMFETRGWRAQLAVVDREKLEAVVSDCVARGGSDFEVRDAMELFPDRDVAKSYARAVAWMRELSKNVGVKLHHTTSGPSTAQEIRALTAKLSRLEEEAMGLGLQLRGLLPGLDGPMGGV